MVLGWEAQSNGLDVYRHVPGMRATETARVPSSHWLDASRVGFGSLLIARVRDCAIQPPGQFASITPEDIERSPIFVGEESEVASNPQRLLKPRTIRGFIHVRLPDRAIFAGLLADRGRARHTACRTVHSSLR